MKATPQLISDVLGRFVNNPQEWDVRPKVGKTLAFNQGDLTIELAFAFTPDGAMPSGAVRVVWGKSRFEFVASDVPQDQQDNLRFMTARFLQITLLKTAPGVSQ